VRAAVAAGHPSTVGAGIEILADGGSAADAAVAACLASCVAETITTGLLGGGHAIVWDGARALNLDCFVDVPSATGQLTELAVGFGEETVVYGIGPASCAVPGVPAGLDSLWRTYGRLPWPRLVEPALRLAREGVPLYRAHANCLAMLAPVMTMHRGAALYAPEGRLLAEGDVLLQPGLVATLEAVAAEGAASVYRGSIADALLAEPGVMITRADLESYEARWLEPVEVAFAGTRFLTRRGLSGLPELLSRFPRLLGRSSTQRVLAVVGVLEAAASALGQTTNLAVSDASGQAVVLTTSLGLGSGDFLSGLDLHLNSMLGEADLIVGALEPRMRMESMMAPSLALDGEGLSLAIGSAGGTRLRTALASVTAGILDERLDPQAAVDRPRFHVTESVVHAEPGVDEQALLQLEARGRAVHRWSDLHHYFGGVSLVSRWGAAADPRRSGAARLV
jgi:gamma-glutamyltranspeptidase/glutathione hydrolase